ncbi:MAG: type II secretion system F family protein [Deltaproteobacteria bacterium HGW-Deltaproteobacteria-13]|jgi:type IV pilus assembly protein PilC|nr:MAG: type II secretion system F family protein [Deltaproteobacteria bacterium HGW-Deltaproteobacteria-13]
MPKYFYQAINQNGEEVSGTVEAESIEIANFILVSRELIPSQVKEQSETNSWLNALAGISKIKTVDLIMFTKQFHSMLVAGIPILRILSILEDQTENKGLKQAISSVIKDIHQGSSLSDALQKFPRIFERLYCDMVKAGEISGNLPIVLERLIYIIEHEAKVRGDIKSALRYPMIVLIALVGAFIALLTFVIPQFVSIFTSAGLVLPWPTRVAMSLYSMLHNYWYVLLVIIIAIVLGLRLYFKTSNGKFVKDSFLLEMPIVGPLFKKAALSRFASIFAILQTSGVPIMQSLTILSATMGNEALTRTFDNIRERIKEGAGISAPLKSSKYFTPMVIDMIAIGEESGKIDEMMRAVAIHYDSEVEYAVKGLSDAIGPVLIVGLAVVVGFFALAIFMPMWDLTQLATKH